MSKGESPVSACRDLTSQYIFIFSTIFAVWKGKKSELLFKDCESLVFFGFWSTVTECRSRWIIPSIQPAAIVILKEQTYVGELNVDHFKGTMKAPCWIVQKEAPMSGWGGGRKGGKEKESTFKQLSALFLHLVLPFSRTLYLNSLFSAWLLFFLYIYLCLLNSFYFNRIVD